MKKAAFIEDLFEGTANAEYFGAYPPPEPGPGTEAILRGYDELMSRFNPPDLERGGKLPEELWKGLKDIGMFGLTVPKEYGGQGLDVTQYLLVTEHMARKDMGMAIIPLAHLSIGIKGIQLFGNESQKKQYLPPAASGEMVFAYALTEAKFGSDAKHIETSAALSEDGSHYMLNGSKTYITNGAYAGGLTVFAQLDPERPGYMGAFIVETGWEGVKVGKDMSKMGLAISSTTSIRFTDVRVPVENLLGDPGDGFKIAMAILNYGRMGLGAASSGAMKQSADDMLARATSRVQFGVPIKEFELVREMIVKARVNGFIASAMTFFTAGLLDADAHARVVIESSHTKLYGTNMAWQTLYDALQVAGGAGYLVTQPYGKRMRDFRVTTVFEGTTEIHSIYPPLYLARKLGGEKGESRARRLRRLLLGALGMPRMPLPPVPSSARRAAREAARNLGAVRRTLCLALLRYGSEIKNRELLLRRITRLSISSFGLWSAIAHVAGLERAGKDTSEELMMLDYFREEAMAMRRACRRVLTSNVERVQEKIFAAIDKGRAPG